MLGTVAMACGCAPPKPATEAQLRVRAAFDLACPPYQIAVYTLDSQTRGVVGCGRRLTYMEECDAARGEDTCSWRLESETPAAALGAVSPVLPAAAPPAYAPAASAPAPREGPSPPTVVPAPGSSGRDFGF